MVRVLSVFVLEEEARGLGIDVRKRLALVVGNRFQLVDNLDLLRKGDPPTFI